MVGGHAGPDDAGTLLAAADAHADAGAFREAVDSLVAANRAARRPPIEERLVALRHEAVASATAPSTAMSKKLCGPRRISMMATWLALFSSELSASRPPGRRSSTRT